MILFFSGFGFCSWQLEVRLLYLLILQPHGCRTCLQEKSRHVLFINNKFYMGVGVLTEQRPERC